MSEAITPELEKIARWIKRLRHEDEARRVLAAMRLSCLGNELIPMLPDLERLLEDADPQVSKLAAYVLKQCRKHGQAA